MREQDVEEEGETEEIVDHEETVAREERLDLMLELIENHKVKEDQTVQEEGVAPLVEEKMHPRDIVVGTLNHRVVVVTQEVKGEVNLENEQDKRVVQLVTVQEVVHLERDMVVRVLRVDDLHLQVLLDQDLLEDQVDQDNGLET